MWKVYRVETDEILKAGFATEDEAKDWMDRQNLEDDDDAITIDEMDSDEEEQWLENHEEDVFIPREKEPEEEEEADIEGLNFRSGAVDLEDDDFYEGDEDFDEDEEDEDEDDDDSAEDDFDDNDD